MSSPGPMMVGVLGTGHLARTTEAALAVLGFNAHRRLKPGRFPIEWEDCELWFVAEDVLDHGELEEVDEALELIREHADKNDDVSQLTVVLLSQVPPGYTRKWADKFKHLYYQVDTIIVKDALQRMVEPEQVVVGLVGSTVNLTMCYQCYLLSLNCPVHIMSYESAELAKCAINYVLASQIRLANELFEAACGVGANYDDVRRVLHFDARIGPKAYLRPGEPNQHLLRDVETIDGIREAAGARRDDPQPRDLAGGK